MRFQFIGCGDAFGSGGRFNTCFHLVGETVNVLIDCGASSLIAMKRLGIDRNAIRAILVTHFHADHFGGIPFFMLDAQFFSRRTEPLIVAGPRGLPAWYERVMETAFPGSAAATRKFDLSLVELEPGHPVAIAGTRVTAAQAAHGPPGGPFLALRVEVEGRSIAYTGDTEWTDALVPAIRDCDLLVAESYFFDRQVKTHLDYATLAAQLPRLRPRRLVLTHMSEEMLARAGSLPCTVAEDGLTIAL
ncbi:MAG: MBL fold metallo-hydrolase [Alphaproteobacteria bacterium]|nr:MBL fold metallo-hydrolase [Alphaproteobacteria bacterium]